MKDKVFKYIQNQYATQAEYLWEKFPTTCVFRHANKKWFAAFMPVEKSKLGLSGSEKADVLLVKNYKLLIPGLIDGKGLLPAYHSTSKTGFRCCLTTLCLSSKFAASLT